MTITPATPAINTSQQPATAIVGTSIADTGHGQRRVQPDRHGHLQPLQQRDGQRHAAVHRHRDALGSGVATSAGYTADGDGHRLLGRHLQRRQQQRRGHQRHGLEPVTITPATPAINTSQQPATAVVGTSIADKATVSGGYNPTGTVTFNLYSNSTASGTPLFTDTETARRAARPPRRATPPTATGTDYWVATYNGDSNNSAVTSGTAAGAGERSPRPARRSSRRPAGRSLSAASPSAGPSTST